jgi:hypothetical protein
LESSLLELAVPAAWNTLPSHVPLLNLLFLLTLQTTAWEPLPLGCWPQV